MRHLPILAIDHNVDTEIRPTVELSRALRGNDLTSPSGPRRPAVTIGDEIEARPVHRNNACIMAIQLRARNSLRIPPEQPTAAPYIPLVCISGNGTAAINQ